MRIPWEEAGLLAQNGPRMELGSNREATVDGCGGVLEYSGESVRVRYGGGVVRFTGRGLRLHSLAARSLVVSGWIARIEFLRIGEK